MCCGVFWREENRENFHVNFWVPSWFVEFLLDPLEAAAAAAKTRELVTSLQFSLSLSKISLSGTNTCNVEGCVVDLCGTVVVVRSGTLFFPASYSVPQQQKKESKEERRRENESRDKKKKRQLARRKLYRLDFLLDRRWRCTDGGECVLFVIECGEEKIQFFHKSQPKHIPQNVAWQCCCRKKTEKKSLYSLRQHHDFG